MLAVRRRSPWRWLLVLASVLGPGFVTASAGNDVGGITTYSQAGAQFGYRMLWLLLPLAVSLIVVQEMATRMGTVTGKGLAALIRENFGVKISFFAMLVLFFINTGIAATEFVGVAAASELFHLSRYVTVPLAVIVVFLFILRFESKAVERVFVVFSLIYVSYIVSAVMAHPNWAQVAHGTFVPSFSRDHAFIFMVIGLIGTTISPYMQFFLQSAIVDKGSDENDLGLARADVVVGSVLGIAIAGFIIIANAAKIYPAVIAPGSHLDPTSLQAVDFARALQPLAGNLAETIFALGILNAGLFTATVLPLSTSFVICEALGFEAAVDRGFREAPVFFSIFAAGLIVGAAIVLLPGIPYIRFTLWAQALQGMALPAELVLMLLIINRRSVMGRYVNSRLANVITWITVLIVGSLSLIAAAQQFLPSGG